MLACLNVDRCGVTPIIYTYLYVGTSSEEARVSVHVVITYSLDSAEIICLMDVPMVYNGAIIGLY